MVSPYDTVPGKIFIGGISSITTQEILQTYFQQFGELSDCVLMQDKTTGKSRGFGFVTYKDSNVIEKVLQLSHVLDGKELDCKKAIRRELQVQNDFLKDESQLQTKKLFVGGLLQTTTEDELRAYFQQFGIIEDLVIMIDKMTGKSRGFGFVTFRSEDSVERVIQQYYENKIGGKWVECKKALPKNSVLPANRKTNFKQGTRDQSKVMQNFDEGKNHEPGFFQNPTDLGPASQLYPRNQNLQNNFEGYPYSGGIKQNLMKPSYEPGFQQNMQYNMGPGYHGYPNNNPQNFSNNNFNDFYSPPGFTGHLSGNFKNQYSGAYPGPSSNNFPVSGNFNTPTMPLKENNPLPTPLMKGNLPGNLTPPLNNIPINPINQMSQGVNFNIQNDQNVNYVGNLGYGHGLVENLVGPNLIPERVYSGGEAQIHTTSNGNPPDTRPPGFQQTINANQPTPFNFSVFSADLNASR